MASEKTSGKQTYYQEGCMIENFSTPLLEKHEPKPKNGSKKLILVGSNMKDNLGCDIMDRPFEIFTTSLDHDACPLAHKSKPNHEKMNPTFPSHLAIENLPKRSKG